MRDEAPEGTGPDQSLFAVLSLLWRGRWYVALSTTAFVVAALVYVLNAREWFQSDTVLMRADQRALSGSLSQLGGLANMAGIRLPAESGSELPLAVLRSRDFAARFTAASQVGTTLLSQGVIKRPMATGTAPARGIEPADATDYFRENILFISEDKKMGLVTVSMRWLQPDVAAEWANGFVALLNEYLRTQAIAEAEQNVSYLRKALAETTVPALQQSIGRVLEAEIQKLLLARANREFAFRVIDEAVVPRERISPRKSSILALGTALGAALGVGLVLMLHMLEQWRRPVPGAGRVR